MRKKNVLTWLLSCLCVGTLSFGVACGTTGGNGADKSSFGSSVVAQSSDDGSSESSMPDDNLADSSVSGSMADDSSILNDGSSDGETSSGDDHLSDTVYTVSEEEWEAAANITNYTCMCYASVDIGGVYESYEIEKKMADDRCYLKRHQVEDDTIREFYIIKEGDEYFGYEENPDWSVSVIESDTPFDEDFCSPIFYALRGKYDSYSYDETERCYKAENISFSYEGVSKADSVTVYFENGKIVRTEMKAVGSVVKQEFYDHNATEVEFDIPEIEEKETYSVLYIRNWDGDYGSEWLDSAIARFEMLYKNTSFEAGKMGVKVRVKHNKDPIYHGTNSESAIYFAMDNSFREWAEKGEFLDITSVIQCPNDDGITIQDRMTSAQKEYFSINGKYYGLPTYSAAQGLVYDIDLFEKYGFYFKEDHNHLVGNSSSDCFIEAGSKEGKSDGPDGMPGTPDDGLPTTYDEFFELCDYMGTMGLLAPMTFSNLYNYFYLGGLFDTLIANDLGADLAEFNYTMGTNGKGMEVQLIDGIETITAENGYMLYRQVEKYNALEFIETLKNGSYYYSPDNFSYKDAQESFIGLNKNQSPVAMLAEGVWWENEAKRTIGAEFVDGRNFGWMPLPRSSQEKTGQNNVYLDSTSAVCFVKAGIDEVQQNIAKEFLQFIYSEDELVKFTKQTNAPWALEYELTDEDFFELSTFGRSVWEFRKNADVVYARDTVLGETVVINNEERYRVYDQPNPVVAIWYSNYTPTRYFEAMYHYYDKIWHLKVLPLL